jgi:hypothetical protein
MAITSAVRYSDGKEDHDGRSKFSWEYPVPDNTFWKDLSFTLGSNFLSNYSEEEIQKLPINPDSTSKKDEKLNQLLQLLQERLAEKNLEAAPRTLYDVDFPTWNKLYLPMFEIQSELGLPIAETTLREMCDRRKDKSNLSQIHTLAGLLVKKGEYAEAEKLETEVKPWMEGKLGKDSPQALSAARILLEAVWRQEIERRGEAERMLEEVKRVVEGMGEGEYGMYQVEERGYYEELERNLRKDE